MKLVHVTEAGTHCYEANDTEWQGIIGNEKRKPDSISALVNLFRATSDDDSGNAPGANEILTRKRP